METFGALTMGRVMGLCFIAAALLNLVQVPLVTSSLSSFGGDCAPMLVAVLLSSAPLPIAWILLSLRQRRTAPPPTITRVRYSGGGGGGSGGHGSSREQPLLPKLARSSDSGHGGLKAPFAGHAASRAASCHALVAP